QRHGAQQQCQQPAQQHQQGAQPAARAGEVVGFLGFAWARQAQCQVEQQQGEQRCTVQATQPAVPGQCQNQQTGDGQQRQFATAQARGDGRREQQCGAAEQ